MGTCPQRDGSVAFQRAQSAHRCGRESVLEELAGPDNKSSRYRDQKDAHMKQASNYQAANSENCPGS